MDAERLHHIRAIPGDATLDEIQELAGYALNAKEVREEFHRLYELPRSASWDDIYAKALFCTLREISDQG